MKLQRLFIYLFGLSSLTAHELSFPEEVKAKLFPKNLEITEVVAEEQYGFTEGPAWTGTFFIFSDIPKSNIYRWDGKGKASIFHPNSNQINGNLVDADGTIYSCSHGGQSVISWNVEKEFNPLSDSHDKKKLNRPNDLTLRSDGSIWFTDPSYRYKNPKDIPQDGNYVYHISPDRKKTTRATDKFNMPNGITLSPDEKTLYVGDAAGKTLHKFDVIENGLTNKTLIDDTFEKTGVDGMCCDSEGRLFVTYSEGIRVYDAESKHLGDILLDEHPTNCTFGGENENILLVTARKKVYAIKTLLKAPPLTKIRPSSN